MIQRKIDPNDLALNDKLIYINRVSKVVKGGKRMSFSALVASGDGMGHVGVGTGKANEVPVAIQKASSEARKNLVKVPMQGSTIPHDILVSYGAARVLIKPAPPGAGVIAGGAIRAVVEAAGIKDIVAKSLGSANKTNTARATLKALTMLRYPSEVVAIRRGTYRAPAPTPPMPPIAPIEEANGE
jgi:small subunit ribosomal protein S5